MMPAHEVLRAGLTLYSPKCVEGAFCELLRLARVLGTSRLLRSLTFTAVAFVVESHLAPIRQEMLHLPDLAYRILQYTSLVSSPHTAEVTRRRPDAEDHRPV